MEGFIDKLPCGCRFTWFGAVWSGPPSWAHTCTINFTLSSIDTDTVLGAVLPESTIGASYTKYRHSMIELHAYMDVNSREWNSEIKYI